MTITTCDICGIKMQQSFDEELFYKARAKNNEEVTLTFKITGYGLKHDVCNQCLLAALKERLS